MTRSARKPSAAMMTRGMSDLLHGDRPEVVEHADRCRRVAIEADVVHQELLCDLPIEPVDGDLRPEVKADRRDRGHPGVLKRGLGERPRDPLVVDLLVDQPPTLIEEARAAALLVPGDHERHGGIVADPGRPEPLLQPGKRLGSSAGMSSGGGAGGGASGSWSTFSS